MATPIKSEEHTCLFQGYLFIIGEVLGDLRYP